MKFVGGHRTLPNSAEVEDILRRLRSPKTISQLSAESGMHPLKVAPAVRILAAKHQIIEVDTDPDIYVMVSA
ncbi:MAG: hypothetical protein ACI381_05525 [Candidatus Methanomethylophilaceae archaeon]